MLRFEVIVISETLWWWKRRHSKRFFKMSTWFSSWDVKFHSNIGNHFWPFDQPFLFMCMFQIWYVYFFCPFLLSPKSFLFFNNCKHFSPGSAFRLFFLLYCSQSLFPISSLILWIKLWQIRITIWQSLTRRVLSRVIKSMHWTPVTRARGEGRVESQVM